MRITILKLLALLIAIAYVVLAASAEDADVENVVVIAAGMLFPLALIWFPEPLGGFTGYMFRGHYVDTETPPFLVAAAGWFILVGLPLLAYWLS